LVSHTTSGSGTLHPYGAGCLASGSGRQIYHIL